MVREYYDKLCRMPFRLGSSVFLLSVLAVMALGAQEPEKPAWRDSPKEFKALKYRNIGPAAGGRVSRVAGVGGCRELHDQHETLAV